MPDLYIVRETITYLFPVDSNLSRVENIVLLLLSQSFKITTNLQIFMYRKIHTYRHLLIM